MTKKFTESISESNPNTLQFIRPICSIGQNICDILKKNTYHVSVVHDFYDRDATKISEKSLTVNNNNTCFPWLEFLCFIIQGSSAWEKNKSYLKISYFFFFIWQSI